jgi:8-oxo-dGTP pyrophosphatase MutT (NUDIX family)
LSRNGTGILRRHAMRTKETSCGVIVTDGTRLILGHATRSPRWDIPKGVAEPGESFAAAACRELREETGLDAPEAALRPLGVFPYRPGKDLALFVWVMPGLPDPATLICASTFQWNGHALPEFDRFGLFTLDEARQHVGKAMAALLAEFSLAALSGTSE